MRGMWMNDRRLTVAGLLAVLLFARPLGADLGPEPLRQNATLGEPTPHWLLYLDMSLDNLAMSRYVLFDADQADFKAHIGSGQMPTLEASPDGKELYVVESWLHGPAQTREDVVSIYDATDYSLSHVIELPGRRRALMAPFDRTTLVGDGRFLLIFNFTPGTSVTVIDTERRRVLETVPTPGCSLLYATGPRGASMICGDGTLLTLQLDERGRVAGKVRSEPFFDPDKDPIMENGVSLDGVWYFPSYNGDVYPVDLRGETPEFGERWALVDHEKKPANWLATLVTWGKAGPWLPGGFQLASVHEARRELFVLTHPVTWSGGEGDHVFPGAEVWVYDVDKKQRVRRQKLRGVGISVYVTPDADPLMLVSAADPDTEELSLEIYDAISGKFLREMDEFGDAAFQFQGLNGR